jgi:hypothetical protein
MLLFFSYNCLFWSSRNQYRSEVLQHTPTPSRYKLELATPVALSIIVSILSIMAITAVNPSFHVNIQDHCVFITLGNFSLLHHLVRVQSFAVKHDGYMLLFRHLGLSPISTYQLAHCVRL